MASACLLNCIIMADGQLFWEHNVYSPYIDPKLILNYVKCLLNVFASVYEL